MDTVIVKYHEFSNSEEAEKWAAAYYSELLFADPETEPYKTLFGYTGSWYKIINSLLRKCPPLNSEQYENLHFGDYQEEAYAIQTINRILQSYTISENIIVYRFTHISAVKKLCKTHFLRKGLMFSDKAFLSTTLVKHNLENFSKEQHCNCLLKLKLSRGLRGAYVSCKNEKTCLDEQEFLLPPGIQFRIEKIRRFSYPMLIECSAVISE